MRRFTWHTDEYMDYYDRDSILVLSQSLINSRHCSDITAGNVEVVFGS
jgi:hypothetical protein